SKPLFINKGLLLSENSVCFPQFPSIPFLFFHQPFRLLSLPVFHRSWHGGEFLVYSGGGRAA
ncbi:MAG TPA: hypothetical protein K8W19_10970, partial [Victivallis vadensis]|nr:hypothetical protein [Victivallis vadensis]